MGQSGRLGLPSIRRPCYPAIKIQVNHPTTWWLTFFYSLPRAVKEKIPTKYVYFGKFVMLAADGFPVLSFGQSCQPPPTASGTLGVFPSKEV